MNKTIYNITYNIEANYVKDWLVWIKNHIPKILATGCFTEAKFSKVLINEPLGTHTYSIQYTTANTNALQIFYNKHAKAFNKEVLDKFGEKVLAFTTELEILDVYTVTLNN